MQVTKHGWNELRPYALGDLGRVWGTLREEDLRELRDGGMTDPAVIEKSLTAMNARLSTWDTDEGPAAIYGVTPTGEPKVGLVWALPGALAHSRWRWISRHIEPELERLGAGYWLLTNFKDIRNRTQITWLKRVGFTFISKTTLAVGGQTQLQFVRIMK